MTNRMQLVFLFAVAVSAIFGVMVGAPFIVDGGGKILATIGHALGLHAAPTSSALAVLGIPFLYLIVSRTRRSWCKKGR